MTWIKICGTTSFDDATSAIRAGADALGFIFYPASPRYIEPQAARLIVARLPEKIEKVGVFVDQTSDAVLATAAKVGLTSVQLPVNDDPFLAEQLAQGCHPRFDDLWPRDRPRLKILAAVSMRTDLETGLARAKEWNAELVWAFLLDSASLTQHGGTGIAFDWKASSSAADEIRGLGKIVVAGGLTPSNVGQAMRILRPWGVDVVSGVEAQPGKKDPEKVQAFVRAVRQADQAEKSA
jgi:phosphoribosylanthranilate isomerase